MLRSLAEQAQKLILLDTQNKVATMFMQSVGNDNRVQIVLLNSTYYEGQGVLWLLGYLKQLDGDKDCLDLLKPLLKIFLSRYFILLKSLFLDLQVDSLVYGLSL